ncbi:MAG: pantetheine-phosphate adenylyltransferase [Clostridia bacterium]|nr:pantetheine-phosphate adenylyltransferase [Clostridia bacterium]
MARAIITGSFDPVTSGHENLIRRASPMFEEVTVVILANTEKKSGLFDPADRLTMVQACIDAAGLGNVKAMLYGGLTSDAAHMLGADYIIRGARNATDFDYEYNLSLIMKRFDPAFETIILPTDPSLSMISSTYVRDLLKYGCELGDAVPEACREMMKALYRN